MADVAQQSNVLEGVFAVTKANVGEFTSGKIVIAALASELKVTMSRARLISHNLEYHSRVREVRRDRARVDPRVTGLVVVALGLVTTGLIVIGVTLP